MMNSWSMGIRRGEDPDEKLGKLPLQVRKLVRQAVELMNAEASSPRAEELVRVAVDNQGPPYCVIGIFRFECGAAGTQFHALKLGQNGVTVLALTADDKVLIVHPERPLQRVGLWGSIAELPQGYVEPWETASEAAKRELLEETGFEPAKVVELGRIRPSGYIFGQNSVVLALGCEKVAEPKPEKSERLGALVRLSREEIRALLLSGKPVDGFLATAWAMYQSSQG